MPFTASAAWTIDQIDVDYFIAAGQTPVNVEYIIWERTGLNAPTTISQQGVLGAAGPGIDDPRVPGTDDWLHNYGSLSINLAAGDYYLTIHGGSANAGETIAVLTGGDLQDEALEQDFMWRSEMFPAPGFQVYNPATLLPGAGMTDPEDRWNLSFVINGTAVPEPATFLVAAGGLGLLFLRRRK